MSRCWKSMHAPSAAAHIIAGANDMPKVRGNVLLSTIGEAVVIA